jgi:peptidyl-prolyl cis-trans isomerase-like 4
MALLLETTLGDLVIDLDIEGSPELCKNVLKLAKARYYTSTIIYNVDPTRFCQLGDPHGDGTGGACIYGLISSDGSDKSVLQSAQRFLKSDRGRPLTASECQEKGRVVATEMNGILDTIGSQLLITIREGTDMALDGYSNLGVEPAETTRSQSFRSIGIVREDENNVLDKIAGTYCDSNGRPYADIRIIRALVIEDPFDDPPGLDRLMKERGVAIDDENRVTASPKYERPPEETVEVRIQVDEVDPLNGEEDEAKMREREEELAEREDKSRAVVLEMLGDLPSAEITAPENVLFVCKLNPITEDEDLELIFSRFDEKVKAEIIRDPETGNSLQFAFVEFSTKKQAAEAYFKMNNTLVDDRRIKVDFSQSVSKEWDKYNQRMRQPQGGGRRGTTHHTNGGRGAADHNPHVGGRGGSGRGRGGVGRGDNGRDRGPDNGRDRGPPATDRGGGGRGDNGRDRGPDNGRDRGPPAPGRGGAERGDNGRERRPDNGRERGSPAPGRDRRDPIAPRGPKDRRFQQEHGGRNRGRGIHEALNDRDKFDEFGRERNLGRSNQPPREGNNHRKSEQEELGNDRPHYNNRAREVDHGRRHDSDDDRSRERSRSEGHGQMERDRSHKKRKQKHKERHDDEDRNRHRRRRSEERAEHHRSRRTQHDDDDRNHEKNDEKDRERRARYHQDGDQRKDSDDDSRRNRRHSHRSGRREKRHRHDSESDTRKRRPEDRSERKPRHGDDLDGKHRKRNYHQDRSMREGS